MAAQPSKHQKTDRIALLLAATGGIIYSSWPLGFWLNPLAANAHLASALEARHEPYNWVFILLDCLSGSLMIAACVRLWWVHARVPVHRLALVLGNVSGFGLATILAAVLLPGCESPPVQQCPHFWQSPVTLLHGIFSVISGVCLFWALASLWWWQRRNHLFDALLVGYCIFGTMAVIGLFSASLGNWPQRYYLTLCTLWLAVFPLAVHELDPATNQKNPSLSIRRAKSPPDA